MGSKSCGKATSQQGTADGKSSKKDADPNGPSEEYAKLTRKWQGMFWTFGYCAGNPEKKYGLPEADHCASREKERSHLVVFFARIATASVAHGDSNNRKKKHCS